MTVDEIISEVDDHGFSDTSSIRKLSALNAAIKDVSHRRAWPFLEKVVTLTFDGTNAAPTNAPTDLRAVMKVIDYTSTSPRRVRFKRTDDMEETYSLTDAGTPYFYYFEGTTLKVWQIPGATQTLRLRYLRTAPAVAAGGAENTIIIPPDYHEALVLRTVIRLYMMSDDTDMAAAFKPFYDEKLAVMTDALITLQHDEPEYIHVVDVDDWDYDF